MNKGLIQFIIILILTVIVLSLLGVSLSGLFNDKTLRENFAFLWHWTVYIWNTYVAGFVKDISATLKNAVQR